MDKRAEKTCLQCGKLFMRRPNEMAVRFAERKFCGVRCAARTQCVAVPDKECPNCGKVFQTFRPSKFKTQKCCSTVCGAIYREAQKRNPIWREAAE